MSLNQVSQSPAASLVDVIPNDSTDLVTIPTRGVYIGGGGNIAVVTQHGETITLIGVVAGAIYPFQINRIKATGTTATNIVACY